MIRPDPYRQRLHSRLRRRQAIRLGLMGSVLGFLGLFGGLFTGVGERFPGFFRPLKIEGLGARIPVGRPEDLLERFAATNDEPILITEGRLFLLRAPDGLLAAYRRCTHLGCTVPWNRSEDIFHCPCHGSLFDKNTGVVRGGPAPRPLDLFTITIEEGQVVVNTNPLEPNLIVRGAYEPEQATPLG